MMLNKNYDNINESDMAKLSNLMNNGFKIQMPDMIKVHRYGKYNNNNNNNNNNNK